MALPSQITGYLGWIGLRPVLPRCIGTSSAYNRQLQVKPHPTLKRLTKRFGAPAMMHQGLCWTWAPSWQAKRVEWPY